ncbi:uncharacterized protein LOC129718423 isoform X2 [Wyeomyia smithii]|uniref:uncharacterized protein LOC129718423 isoform X2 n=1 Tax=Wyeomyia smithii TaxID=174621 RepID=UPI002467D79A|nr:uncharacterized protein LOC129718423 isoform X2 [Wyeomyia smithii]
MYNFIKEDFWSLIQEEIGFVPTHVQNILKFEGLTASSAFGSLSRCDIETIENDLRTSVVRIRKWLGTDATMSDIYGVYADQPEEFKFTLGDKLIIQTIAETIKEKGIKRFLDRHKHTADSLPDLTTAHKEQEIESLIKRIQYNLSNSSSDLYLWESSAVSCEQGTGGTLVAKISCPICKKKLKSTRYPPRSWQTFNVIRHLNGHQKTAFVDRNLKSAKKKKITCAQTRDIYGDEVHRTNVEQVGNVEDIAVREIITIERINDDVDCTNYDSSTDVTDSLYSINFLAESSIETDFDEANSSEIIPTTCSFDHCEQKHTMNKFRNRLLNGDMEIGSYIITKEHLKRLIMTESKDKHGLCYSDIELKGKMRFGPIIKLINSKVSQCLKTKVRGSEGTVMLLDMMSRMYRSFIDTNVTLLDRVYNIWFVNFLVRGWRNWCLQKRTDSKLCITTNAYYCVELNSHAILKLIVACRERRAPEQCIITHLSSQPCEKLFANCG